MGLFDTALNKARTIGVQLKAGECSMYNYVEGESVEGSIADGVYYGYEGVVVIEGGIVKSVTEEAPEPLPNLPTYNKWGGAFDPKTESMEDASPVFQAIKALRASGK